MGGSGERRLTMPVDFIASMPLLLPRAIAWAEAQAAIVLVRGIALKAPALELAREVGVTSPASIRIGIVDHFPLPADVSLCEAALQSGLLGPGTIGLTLGYAVLVCRGHEFKPRLLSHEFRHVYQYEAAGSIAAFLPVYLQQIVAFGYVDAPFEADARAHEYRSTEWELENER
jgi:hypothetical protein